MVAQRRFGPLIVVVFAALCVVIARMFQVQVVEHEVWAQQAAGLVRSARVLPSHRGSFLDRNGVVLVKDSDVYQIELRYRDFRRGHPLGILAHARASLEMRAVTLAEALEHRAQWTQDLLQTTPALLDAFARGAPCKSGSIDVPASGSPQSDLRGRRAQDVRWYAAQLLGLDERERTFLRKLEGAARERTFVDLVAERRKIAPAALLARVQSDGEAACAALAQLTELLPAEDAEPERGEAGRSGLPRLLAQMEVVRSELEDELADELFRVAAGFDAGCVSTEALQSAFDLDWIARLLRWDDARLQAWIGTRRTRRAEVLDGGILPRILVQVDLEDETRAPERLLDEIARLWRDDPERDEQGRPPPWRETEDLIVLGEISTLFADASLPPGVQVPDLVLPFQDEELRGIPPGGDDQHGDDQDGDDQHVDGAWRVVGMVSDLAGKDQSGADEPLREPHASTWWAELATQRAGLESAPALAELRRLVHALDRRHAAAADRLFSSLLSARGGDADAGKRLVFAPDRLKRAEVQEKYVLIDRGNRPLRLFAEPTYDLVQRVARHPERYRGFEVQETTRRDPVVTDRQGEPCAGLLVGSVRKPFLREMLQQSADERRLSELRWQVMRSDADEHEIRALVARLQLADEWTGGSGLEAYLDPELRGKPGWYETEGLEEAARTKAGARSQAALDGQDVALTIDAKLQLAAQDLLAHPELPNDSRTDPVWFGAPVGAIVLMTPDGDVLAAASAPARSGETPVPGRDGERAIRRERTLQRPTFQPPGSVFKPFVSAYALSHRLLDPEREFECVDLGRGRGGFESMHCTGIHFSSDVNKALTVSCNSYFAQLGLLFDTDQALDMMRTFGFGQPTGVRCFGSQGRSGLVENTSAPGPRFAKAMKERSTHLRFANGLTVVEATPMQVGRAMAGIVTGRLPDVRLVKSVGGREIPQASRPLDLDAQSLAIVRAALRDVVEAPEGSAHRGDVHEASLGFTFACKTGSADYRQFALAPGQTAEERAEIGKVRKHTWIAGWFPVEAPKAILVVYLHDVAETSSHTAVHVVAQFLHTPAVKEFVAAAMAEGAR